MREADGALTAAPFQAPEVWLVDLVACASALADAEAKHGLLPLAFRAEEERRLAHIALRVLLSRAGARVAGQPFMTGGNGKPRIDRDCEFSLSHTAGFALVGLGGHTAIGVDIERRGRALRMSHERAQRLRAAGNWVAACGRSGGGERPPLLADGDDGTLQAWVRLEAISKVEGIGIGRVLSAFGVFGRPDTVKDHSLKQGLAKHSVRDLESGKLLTGAVAMAGHDASLRIRRMPTQVMKIEQLMAAP